MADGPLPNNKPDTAGATPSGFALRFISGKYQGGEFALADGAEVVVGRSSDSDMVLVEELVSRRHARITVKSGSVLVEDLGSTNGIFVNGERVQTATLREGDRILVGTSILKVMAMAPSLPEAQLVPDAAVEQRVTARHRSVASGSDDGPRMSGSLEEIPLPDLLQLFANSRKSGVLVVRFEGREGRIVLDQGKLHYAFIEAQPELAPFKAIYRMLDWTRGIFELEPPDEKQFETPLDATVQEVLMEAFRQRDELSHLEEQMPPAEQRLVLKTPLEAPLHELEQDHLDVLQLSLNCPSIRVLLERSRLTELETAKIVTALISRGYLQAVPSDG